MVDAVQVEVRRSRKRRRTVSAYRDGELVVVLMPAWFTRAEEEHWVDAMVTRLQRREQRVRPSDQALLERAHELSMRYLDNRVQARSVRWVDNQQSRWGSCTIDDASIRMSRRLQVMPSWVVDYVLLHELTHLVVPGHGPDFWMLLDRYPRTERARGYLEGVAGVAGLPARDD